MAAEALAIYEASVCSGCGHSAYLAHNILNSGEFEAREVQCLGCEAMEMHRGLDAKSPDGTRVYVHNCMSDDVEEVA